MEARGGHGGSWGWVRWLFVGAVFLAPLGCGGDKNAPKKEDELYREAQIAEYRKNHDEAIAKYTESLGVKPTQATYFARGYLYARLGKDAEAVADAEAGLALEPEAENRDLKWLVGQLKKPKEARFKGKDALPPSSSK